jgi:amino acid adenylation domain-containing protein
VATLTLYEWFARSADRHPDTTALQVGDVRLTYRELRDAARRMAGRIAAHTGTTPAKVGILASRSPTAYIGYLATLALGATAVPMNPTFPLARNLTVASAAGADVVVADAGGADQLADLGVKTGAPTIAAAGDGWRDYPGSPPEERPAGLDTVAYTLFTSGSMGTPKGVPITHRNVSAYLDHMIGAFPFGPGARWLQNAELTFDSSIDDMFLAWGSGGSLVVPQRNDLLGLVRFVAANDINHCVIPPSAVSFARRLRSLSPGRMPSLRCTLFGAEQLTWAQVAAWRAAAPNAAVYNIYGPTEVTVSCTWYRAPDHAADWPQTSNGTVPIGRPHPLVEHLLLDPAGRPAAEGELCVRGPQRFGGYLDPTNNVDRFVTVDARGARPWDGGPITDAHWYRTGDRVRVEGGDLVHLGRLDDQVKIRGHRVELGEVEAVLRRHPSVDQVAALATTAADGETDIVAAHSGEPVDQDELVALVQDCLPAYMLPRRFVYIAVMPRNSSGKLDRARLAAMLANDPLENP